jgi:hypothetical protein
VSYFALQTLYTITPGNTGAYDVLRVMSLLKHCHFVTKLLDNCLQHTPSRRDLTLLRKLDPGILSEGCTTSPSLHKRPNPTRTRDDLDQPSSSQNTSKVQPSDCPRDSLHQSQITHLPPLQMPSGHSNILELAVLLHGEI